MRRDKYGVERELEFREWCTRVRRHADEARAAANSAQMSNTSAAHALTQVFDESNVAIDFFKRIACDLLTNVPTLDQ